MRGADMQAIETLALEWLTNYAQRRVSPMCLRDADFATHIDRVTGDLVLTMKAHVLANRRDAQVEYVPFAKSMQLERYASWWQGWKPNWIASRWPRKTVTSTVMVDGEVAVTRTPYDTFPDCKVKYPSDLGRPVVHFAYSAEDYRSV